MERFFEVQDAFNKLHQNLRKYNRYKLSTRKQKISDILRYKADLKNIIKDKNLNKEVRSALFLQYKVLRGKINESIRILKGKKLNDSTIQNNSLEEDKAGTSRAPEEERDNKEDEDVEEEEDKNVEEEEEQEEDNDDDDDDNEETTSSDSEVEEDPKMAALDLSVAMKLVEKFDGNQSKISSFLESIDYLRQTYAEVPEQNILNFLKIRLIGPAHGSINTANTIAGAKELLKQKFGIKITPQAIQNEMIGTKQRKETITEFGEKISALASKLAAAYVSQGTFNDEAAASDIVQPIAVNAFTTGIKDPQTAFFVKARNPTLLNKAISDALEVTPTTSTNTENVLFVRQGGYKNNSTNYNSYNRNNYRGRGRGYGNYRGRGNGNFRGHNGNFRGQNNGNHNRSNYHNNQYNGSNNAYNNNTGNYPHNNRGRGSYRGRNEVNLAEGMNATANQPTQQQNQQQQEHESNLIDLFR